MSKIRMDITVEYDDAIYDVADAGDIDEVLENCRAYVDENPMIAGDVVSELIDQLGEYVVSVDATFEQAD